VRLAVPHVEMGQGITTGLAMLAAEELEMPVDRVVPYHPRDPQPFHANFAVTLQKRPEELSGVIDWFGQRFIGAMELVLTGGSTATINAWVPVRRAAAAARLMLEEAGAQRLGVPRSEVKAEAGAILHAASGRSVPYAELAAAAAAVAPPPEIVLKAPDAWRVIGRDTPRLDTPSKVDGTAVFASDVRPPGLRFASVALPETFGATLASANREAAAAVPGVVKVVDIANAVAVVADTTWAAMNGVAALGATWTPANGAPASGEAIAAAMRAAAAEGGGHIFRAEGNPDRAVEADGALVLEYESPFLAHATMEPASACALVKDGVAAIWSGAQTTLAMVNAAKAHGLEADCNVTFAGGGFGRRAEADVIAHAVDIAAQMPGTPVLLTWSREDDLRHAPLRPASVTRVTAAAGPDGLPLALDISIATQSVTRSFSSRNMPFTSGGDGDPLNVEGAVHLPYRVPNLRVAARAIETPVPVGFWRSVGHSFTAFAVESAIDEMAHRAKADPFAFRLKLLKDGSRHMRLAEALKQASGWSGAQSGPGKGRGIAIHESFRTLVGQVVDVSVTADKAVRVERVVCVVDCGVAVNPQQVKAQMESGVVFALSAAMLGEAPIESGAVAVSNFHDYPMALMKNVPAIETVIIDSREPPGGIGEPGTPPMFAALANAIFAATGERVRRLPLARAGFSFA
jgi:isoquinoline 1-oxidoreductase beta subunit